LYSIFGSYETTFPSSRLINYGPKSIQKLLLIKTFPSHLLPTNFLTKLRNRKKIINQLPNQIPLFFSNFFGKSKEKGKTFQLRIDQYTKNVEPFKSSS
jgi:hypothetical protein